MLGADAIYPDEFETATSIYDSNIQDSVLGWINDALEYVQDPTTFVFSITDWIGNFILDNMLTPVQNLLMDTPWFVVLGCLTAIAYVLSGMRPGHHDLPDARPDRRHRGLGAGAGHRLAGAPMRRHRRRDRDPDRDLGGGEPARREGAPALLDTLQTLPQLVYIILFIYLMPVLAVPGVVASVLYAIPVIIRLVTAGIRAYRLPPWRRRRRSAHRIARCSPR